MNKELNMDMESIIYLENISFEFSNKLNNIIFNMNSSNLEKDTIEIENLVFNVII